jgi:glycosyltransferase involved in cell wall biosynthesis
MQVPVTRSHAIEDRSAPRVLIAIPAYDEAATIEGVVNAVRATLPDLDLLVVNDGSRDATDAILRRIGQRVATHYCNLGYGRTVQTALKFAARHGYDALITCDGDGQHRAEDLRRVYEAYRGGDYDVLIGSRFVDSHRYDSEPPIRRAGMRLFSALIALLTGVRVYDTSSGMKAISRRAFDLLTHRPFVDFHAEAIVYLIESRLRVGECSIEVGRRTHGMSMYTALSALTYPVKVSFLILLSVIEAKVLRGRSRA